MRKKFTISAPNSFTKTAKIGSFLLSLRLLAVEPCGMFYVRNQTTQESFENP